MIRSFAKPASLLVALGLMASVQICAASSKPVAIPALATDIPASTAKGLQKAVFAGGCFWGVEAVYRHVKGVTSAVSGYAGGTPSTANYTLVSAGLTAHAEAVEVTYDPEKVSYGDLLRVFFSVVHDPTQLNRQGPDTGPQYRSAIFFTNNEQQAIALAYIKQLDAAKVFPKPIVTQVVTLPAFYAAEAYHQNYAARNPTQPYIAINDLPKIGNLKGFLPALYTGK